MKLTELIFEKLGVPRFGSYLDLSSYRHKLLAGNVSNVSTPGYKAQDIDFTAEFARLSGRSSQLAGITTDDRHIPTGAHADRSPRIEKERVEPGMINSVNIDEAIASMAQNELQFTIGAQLLRRRFDGLRSVITSE